LDVVCGDLAIAASIDPARIRQADPENASDLITTLAVVRSAANLGALLSVKSRQLIRLRDQPQADYFFGTSRVGVVLRPADHLGRTLAASHTLGSLMKIEAVVLLAAGIAMSHAVSA
jgi:hypothetical protein